MTHETYAKMRQALTTLQTLPPNLQGRLVYNAKLTLCKALVFGFIHHTIEDIKKEEKVDEAIHHTIEDNKQEEENVDKAIVWKYINMENLEINQVEVDKLKGEAPETQKEHEKREFLLYWDFMLTCLGSSVRKGLPKCVTVYIMTHFLKPFKSFRFQSEPSSNQKPSPKKDSTPTQESQPKHSSSIPTQDWINDLESHFHMLAGYKGSHLVNLVLTALPFILTKAFSAKHLTLYVATVSLAMVLYDLRTIIKHVRTNTAGAPAREKVLTICLGLLISGLSTGVFSQFHIDYIRAVNIGASGSLSQGIRIVVMTLILRLLQILLKELFIAPIQFMRKLNLSLPDRTFLQEMAQAMKTYIINISNETSRIKMKYGKNFDEGAPQLTPCLKSLLDAVASELQKPSTSNHESKERFLQMLPPTKKDIVSALKTLLYQDIDKLNDKQTHSACNKLIPRQIFSNDQRSKFFLQFYSLATHPDKISMYAKVLEACPGTKETNEDDSRRALNNLQSKILICARDIQKQSFSGWLQQMREKDPDLYEEYKKSSSSQETSSTVFATEKKSDQFLPLPLQGPS